MERTFCTPKLTEIRSERGVATGQGRAIRVADQRSLVVASLLRVPDARRARPSR